MNTYKTNAKPRCITKDNIPVFCSYDKLLNINDIKLNPDNPNKHPEKQLKMLGEVIKGNGWRQSVTISRLSHLVVKGHGRILAAKMLNLCEIPVEYQEYSNKDEEMADLLADNRIAELAEMDNDMPCSIINDMDEYLLDFTGFTSDEISVILDTLPDITQEFIEDDEIEEEFKLQDKTITQKGDVWCLGKHKLLCGDSTDKDSVLSFMKEERAQLVVTDPPYQIRNSSKRGDIVFDSFAGSGTTLIACQKNNRICRTIELDERYCDVIVNRYINLSENTSDVFVIRNGKKMSFEEVKN